MQEKVIYKYTVHDMLDQKIDVPVGSKLLSVQAQRDAIQAWFLVDPNAVEACQVSFAVVQTGRRVTLKPGLQMAATVQFFGGRYVVHVFTDADRA